MHHQPIVLWSQNKQAITKWTHTLYQPTEENSIHAILTSPIIELTTPCIEVIPSWQAITPPGSWIEMQIRGQIYDQWSDNYRIAAWNNMPNDPQRHSFGVQNNTYGFVATDTLCFKAPACALQIQVQLHTNPKTQLLPELRALSLCITPHLPPESPHNLQSAAISLPNTVIPPLDMPLFSQYAYGAEQGWCSPTALGMILGYWYRHTAYPQLAPFQTAECVPDLIVPMVYDPAYNGTGNWSFNTAYAASLGLEAYITRLTSPHQVARWLAAGIPLITSIAWGYGELDNAAIAHSNGHLLIIRGITGDQVYCADPAGVDSTQVARTYTIYQFFRQSQKHSAGIVYAIYPAEWPIPEPGTHEAWRYEYT